MELRVSKSKPPEEQEYILGRGKGSPRTYVLVVPESKKLLVLIQSNLTKWPLYFKTVVHYKC